MIEDLNLAPPEVLAALAPLLANRHLHLPQRAQLINAAPGFQLLASITTAPGSFLPSSSSSLSSFSVAAAAAAALLEFEGQYGS